MSSGSSSFTGVVSRVGIDRYSVKLVWDWERTGLTLEELKRIDSFGWELSDDDQKFAKRVIEEQLDAWEVELDPSAQYEHRRREHMELVEQIRQEILGEQNEQLH